MLFRSAVDWWLLLIIVVAAVVVLLNVGPQLQAGRVLSAVASVLLVVALPIWLLGATYYRVQDGTLYVRAGPFFWRIPVAEITGVKRSRSVLSSPALSLDRLEIKYGQGRSILVSPKDRDGFMQALGRTLDS